MTSGLRLVVLTAFAALLSSWQDARFPNGVELVHFASARYQVGPLQQRLARERGEAIAPPPAEIISGYLTKPEGDGPFPAVVHLHGCNGLSNAFKAGTDKGQWSEQLAAWGYAVLVVDSFTTRGIEQACTTVGKSTAARVGDAYGALAYLSAQPFVDARRIALLGFSQGAITALTLVGARDFDLFESEAAHKFKAAVAFYPTCPNDGTMTVPTLILIGELDDWTRAIGCTPNDARPHRRRQSGAADRLSGRTSRLRCRGASAGARDVRSPRRIQRDRRPAGKRGSSALPRRSPRSLSARAATADW
jgi:dienelactone hydrolase